MNGSKIYNDIGRGQLVKYKGADGRTRFMTVTEALDIIPHGSSRAEAILECKDNRHILYAALDRLKIQIAEVENAIEKKE